MCQIFLSCPQSRKKKKVFFEQPLKSFPICLQTRTQHVDSPFELVSDLLLSLDDGNISVNTFLDLSAAFGTIDRNILRSRPWVCCRYTLH